MDSYTENKNHHYPPITPLSQLEEEFSEFFDSKIAKIMNHLQSNIEGNPQWFIYKEDHFLTKKKTAVLQSYNFMMMSKN